jgi:hypothetical protein
VFEDDHLSTMMAFEADRMSGLVLDDAVVAPERDVVLEAWPPSDETAFEKAPAGCRSVPLNMRCSRKWAIPDWPIGSSAEPLRYQTMCVATGAWDRSEA